MISKTRAEAFGNTKWIALAILCVTYFLQQGTRQIYNATLPQIKADFLAGGVSDVQLGVIGSVFSLVYGVVVPFAGVAADLFGRKRIVVLALLLFSTGICASGFAGGLGMLLAMYGVLAAVGQCMFPSPATSLIAQLHPKTRATALSIFQGSLYLGIVACSCAAGWLGGLGEGGWRKAFWTLLPSVMAVFGAILVMTVSGVAFSVYSRYALVMLVATMTATSLVADSSAGFWKTALSPLLSALTMLPLVFATGAGAAGSRSLGLAFLGGSVAYAFLGRILSGCGNKLKTEGNGQ